MQTVTPHAYVSVAQGIYTRAIDESERVRRKFGLGHAAPYDCLAFADECLLNCAEVSRLRNSPINQQLQIESRVELSLNMYRSEPRNNGADRLDARYARNDRSASRKISLLLVYET